jgi:nicotinamide mononucleotide (NMN) deamidase PncC
MTQEYDKFLMDLVGTYQDQRKISVVSCGGGSASLARLSLIPGASKLLHSIDCPYDQTATINILRGAGIYLTETDSMVSRKVALGLGFAAMNRSIRDIGIGVTGAITTNRYRRGNNAAYISICMNWLEKRIVVVNFDKLPESVYSDPIVPWREQTIFATRQKEDETIAMVALCLATDRPLPNDLYGKVTVL